jgi:GcrA cell cycle regulator
MRRLGTVNNPVPIGRIAALSVQANTTFCCQLPTVHGPRGRARPVPTAYPGGTRDKQRRLDRRCVIRQLRSLWDEGHSTAAIGRRLGVSKNAVVGKAHRLDLPDRPSPIRRGSPPKPRPAPRPRPSLPPLASLNAAPAPVTTTLAPSHATDRGPAAPPTPSIRPLGTRVVPCC